MYMDVMTHEESEGSYYRKILSARLSFRLANTPKPEAPSSICYSVTIDSFEKLALQLIHWLQESSLSRHLTSRQVSAGTHNATATPDRTMANTVTVTRNELGCFLLQMPNTNTPVAFTADQLFQQLKELVQLTQLAENATDYVIFDFAALDLTALKEEFAPRVAATAAVVPSSDPLAPELHTTRTTLFNSLKKEKNEINEPLLVAGRRG